MIKEWDEVHRMAFEKRRQEKTPEKERTEEKEKRDATKVMEETEKKLERLHRAKAVLEENLDALRKGKCPCCTLYFVRSARFMV